MIDPQLHCNTCNLQLSSQGALQQHTIGKKHMKLVEIETQRVKLQQRSIFMYGFGQDALKKKEILDYFQHLQLPVDKVIFDQNKSTYCIVEFMDECSAKCMLDKHNVKINAVGVMIKPRIITPNVIVEYDTQHIMQLLSEMEGDIDVQLCNLVSQLQLKDHPQRECVILKICSAMTSVLPPGVTLVMFGSSVSSLGDVNSDIDATLVTVGDEAMDVGDELLQRHRQVLLTSQPLALTGEGKITNKEMHSLSPGDQIRFISRMLNYVRKVSHLKITQQTPIMARRHPLLRFTIDNKYRCDICMNNQAAIKNTKWLTILAQKDARFVQLVFFVRCWFRFHELSGDEPHLLNNYTISLIIVVFLQTQNIFPPVANFINDLESIISWQPTVVNNKSASQLLTEFYVFLNALKLNKCIFSARLGQIIERDVSFVMGVVNVEDPFVVEHNTACVFTHKGVTLLRNALHHACSVLQTPQCTLSQLMQPIDKDIARKCTSPLSKDSSKLKGHFWIELEEGVDLRTNFEQVVLNMQTIMVAILKVNVIDASQQPTNKRMRMDNNALHTVFGVRVTVNNAWQGRRGARREIVRQMSNATLWQIEINVTEKLCQEKSSESTEGNSAFELDMDLSVNESCPSTLNITLTHNYGPHTAFNNFVHFMQTFIPKLKQYVLQTPI